MKRRLSLLAASLALLTGGLFVGAGVEGATTPTAIAAQAAGYMKGTETLSWASVPDATGYALTRDGTSIATAGSGATSTRFSVSAGQHTLAVRPIYPVPTTSTTTTPAGWTVAPPQQPITTMSNVNGVGLLVVGGPKAYSDYAIDGTTDSAVLLGPECAGTSFSRFHITRAASVGNGPGYGRHAFYVKAANVTVTDLYAQLDPTAKDVGSIFTLRYHGFTATRFDVSGLWFASFFDDDPNHVGGTATFTDGKVKYSSSSAMLVDAQLAWNITVTNVDFTGPNDSLLHLDSGSVMPHLTLNNVTENGKPATAAMTNLPASAITITITKSTKLQRAASHVRGLVRSRRSVYVPMTATTD